MSDEVKMPLPRSLQEIVGSLLFASPDPLTAGELREAIRALDPEEGESREVMEVYKTCTGREIDAALKGLGKALDVAGCGFELVCTGGTYRLQTSASCGRYVRAMLKMDRPSRIGRASLETLAIIAYRQPITKGEVEQIRGVDVTGNIKTLADLQLIRLVGKSELPGHPFLYGTTPLFLEHFGLANLQQLNELDPTLQRSNPKLKAEAYKRKEEVKVEGQGQELIDSVSKKDEGEKGKAEEGKDGNDEESALVIEEAGTDDGAANTKDDDDDFFIDDTPDELVDDEDDDEDEDEEDGDDGSEVGREDGSEEDDDEGGEENEE